MYEGTLSLTQSPAITVPSHFVAFVIRRAHNTIFRARKRSRATLS
jgi:hypothetical protein